MHVGMLVVSDVSRDARVLREATCLAELGHAVTVASLPLASPEVIPPKLEVLEFEASSPLTTTRLAPGPPPAAWERIGRWMLVEEHHRRLVRSYLSQAVPALARRRPQVVHAHDFETLAAGLDLGDRLGAKVVYDSHEVWRHRRALGRPTPARRRWEARREARLGHRCDAIITVGEGVARWLESTHGWTDVAVVRNAFPMLPGRRQAVSPPTGILYAGRIGRGRDIPVMEATPPSLRAVAIGPADHAFARGLEDRIEVLPPVPVADVVPRMRSLGLAAVLVGDGPLNHRLALPNKLFQAVQAGVPVVASDLPEIRRVVQEHELGTLYRCGDRKSFRMAVDEVVARHGHHVEAVHHAASTLGFDRDGWVLRRIYEALARGAPVPEGLGRTRPS